MEKIIIPVLHGDGAAEDVVQEILVLMESLLAIKEFVEFLTVDWSLRNRYLNPEVIQMGADMIAKYKIAVKVPGITPDLNDVKDILSIKDHEEALKVLEAMPSPNGPLRKAIGPGGMFRQFRSLDGFLPWMRLWENKVIHIARMHVGDEYGASQMRIDEPGNAYIFFRPSNGGRAVHQHVKSYERKGVLMAYGNDWDMILSYARTCFKYALAHNLDVRFATKDTILKVYDAMFVEAFEMVYGEVKVEMDKAGLKYEHRLVDAAATLLNMAMDSEKWLLCLKNFSGDIITDLGSAMGSSGMITSEIISEDGEIFVAETGHGTIDKKHGDVHSLRFNPFALVYMFAKAVEVAGYKHNNMAVSEMGKLIIWSATEALKKCPTDDMAALKGYPSQGTGTLEYLQMLKLGMDPISL